MIRLALYIRDSQGNRSEARASDLRSHPGLWLNRTKQRLCEGYKSEYSPRTCSMGKPAGDILCLRSIPLHRLVQTSATFYTIQVHSTIPPFGTAILREIKQILSGLLRSPHSFFPPGNHVQKGNLVCIRILVILPLFSDIYLRARIFIRNVRRGGHNSVLGVTLPDVEARSVQCIARCKHF